MPMVDHYCGEPRRIEKSLALQASMAERLGGVAFDVTLDCEDGAAAGEEISHANALSVCIFTHFAATKNKATDARVLRRIAVRIHPVDHPAFGSDVRLLVAPHAQAGDERLVHVMLPKTESVADVEKLVALLNELGCTNGWQEIIARTDLRDEVGKTSYLKTECRRVKQAD